MKRLLAAAVAFSTLAAFGNSAVRPHDISRADSRPNATNAFGKVPLAFDPNRGQANPSVKFLSHFGGSTLVLTSTEAVLSLPGARRGARLGDLSSPAPTSVLGMTFVGANPSAQVVGTDRLPGGSNYFIGNDPTRWRTGVPRYGKVTYQDIYPGIDLTFYGNQSGRLEYDFAVSAGANPSLIQLAFQGANALHLDPAGDLVLPLARNDLLQRKPQIYQLVDGTRNPISGGYVLDGDHMEFSIGSFDPTRSLLIDPEVVYSTYLGGSGDELGEVHPAVDSSGHVYICGETDSVDFPVTPGVVQPSLAGGFDAFVTKFSTDGSGIVYSTYLGGTSDFDVGVACTVDGSGNIYMAGATNSTDFPTTAGAFQTMFHGGFDDGYVAKLSPDGSDLLYSTYVGGSGDDELVSLQVDSSGDVFASGDASSTDFPTTAGAFQISNAGGHGRFCKPACDAVILKLNPAGSNLIYSTYLGGPGDDGFQPNVAIDAAGDAYVVGTTSEKRFPTTPGVFQRHFGGGGADAFVTKLDPSGSALIYSTYLGGGGDDLGGLGIAVDGSGNAYLAGFTCSRDFPTTPGAFQTSNAGGLDPKNHCFIVPGPLDGFVTKINPTGAALVFSTYLGGSGGDIATNGPLIDSVGHVFVTGITDSTDFPVTPDALQASNNGAIDGFMTELTTDGSSLIFSTYWGGTADDGINGSVIDSSGNLYVTGCTASKDFPVTPGAFQTTFQGGKALPFFIGCAPSDAFVTKIAFGG